MGVIVAHRRQGFPFAACCLFLQLSLGGMRVLTVPLDRGGGVEGLVLVILLVDFLAFLGGEREKNFLSRALSSILGKAYVIVSLSLFIPFGLLEISSWIATENGILKYYTPMETVFVKGTEDWRMAHITNDKARQPDPILFWRPVYRYPYNEQGFKGPVVKVPKPKNTFRLMAYGDSNTDGPDRGGWTEQLGELLGKRQTNRFYEVLNAGVTGYSSYQGLQKFRQEVEKYRPDLVLVSFGWNDLPEALGAPDRDFKAPSAMATTIRRLLLRYRTYLVMKYYISQLEQPQPTGKSRVPLSDYLKNLQEFFELGTKYNAEVVFLTRPHKKPVNLMVQETSWRKSVPDYNNALIDFSKRIGASYLDVQGIFESKYSDMFADECHFTLVGHSKMAQFLYDKLSKEGLIQ